MLWNGPEGLHWEAVILDVGEGLLVLEQVPAGELIVARRPERGPALFPDDSWVDRIAVELAPGTERTVAAP